MLAETTNLIKIYDKNGFHYEVILKLFPSKGFAIAYYKDAPIADVFFQKLNEPFSDNDLEWEIYEQNLLELFEMVEIDISIDCQNYFNNHF